MTREHGGQYLAKQRHGLLVGIFRGSLGAVEICEGGNLVSILMRRKIFCSTGANSAISEGRGSPDQPKLLVPFSLMMMTVIVIVIVIIVIMVKKIITAVITW